uniref:Immunoglobulin-binding protein 1 n=1 Tax=Sphenodon punctatus TaxID=8508 RepID=A0A8D0G7K5_SPHPU
MAADTIAAQAGEAEESPRLSELLESGWRLMDEVETSTEPSSGVPEVQRKVLRGIRLLEQASRGMAELQLFSHNEELEEIASADLRFMMVPALLGALIMKQGNQNKRMEHLQSARAYFMDFLKLCKDYKIGKFALPQMPANQDENEATGAGVGVCNPNLMAMASNRNAKIERYKQKKEVENRLASLKTLVESGQAEEEQVREFYMLHIQKWIGTCLEEIESIDQEMVILKSRDAFKQAQASHAPQPTRPPMKPFILTRDAVQAKVFGAGYPSLATMTVDDWYDQHRKQGVLPDQGIPPRSAELADEEQQQEKKVDEDDEKTLRNAREWDDWKDTHPRGYGNRKNMG